MSTLKAQNRKLMAALVCLLLTAAALGAPMVVMAGDSVFTPNTNVGFTKPHADHADTATRATTAATANRAIRADRAILADRAATADYATRAGSVTTVPGGGDGGDHICGQPFYFSHSTGTCIEDLGP